MITPIEQNLRDGKLPLTGRLQVVSGEVGDGRVVARVSTLSAITSV